MQDTSTLLLFLTHKDIAGRNPSHSTQTLRTASWSRGEIQEEPARTVLRMGVVPVTPYPDVPVIYFREPCLSSDKVA